MLKVIIVDDSKTFRDGAKFYIEGILKHTVIGEFENGLEYLACDKLDEADIIFMDIKMPKMDGIEAARKSLTKNNKLKIIAITEYHEKIYKDVLLQTGFKGIVLKKNIYKELQKAIEATMNNQMYFQIK